MELNTKGRYAVMAMADIAKFGAERILYIKYPSYLEDRIPKATKIPKAWTGGIGVKAREAKPAAEVSEVKSMGLKRWPIT